MGKVSVASGQTFSRSSIALAAMLLVPGVASRAGEWTFDPRIGVREYYSDNITLAPEGQEQHDFVTEINPAIRIRGEGARLVASLDYIYQVIDYARGTEKRSTNPILQALATTELVERLFFIDTEATMRQENVDATGRTSTDNIAVTGNSTDVTTFLVSPYVRHRFGSYAETEGRYTYDTVTTSGESNESDSSSNRVGLFVNSGSRFQRMPWDVVYDRQKIDNEGGAPSTFEQIEGSVRYRITRKYGLLARVGYDNNEFPSSQAETSGFRWQLGATWTPSPRTFLEAGWGQQFSGPNAFLDFSHESRRSVWTASFSETVTNTRNRQLERRIIPLEDPFGVPIVDPTLPSADAPRPLEEESLSDETFVEAQFEMGYALQGKRSQLITSIFHLQRDFQESGDSETVYGARAGLSRRLSSRTTARIDTLWQVTEQGVDALAETRWDSSISLTHRLGESVSGTVGYEYQRNESDGSGSEFAENRLSAGLQVVF